MGTTVEDKATLTFDGGRVVDIKGDRTARAIGQWLSSWDDPNSFGLSHVGWGMQKNTVWTGDPRFTAADGESYYGGVLMALGSNITEMGAPNSGLGGKRTCKSHLDIPIRNHDFYVDGERVLSGGEPKKFI
jgi:2,5-dihydroxypyridine 5,6-dioxygenase